VKSKSHLVSLLISFFFVPFSMQAIAEPADDTGFVNSIIEDGQCGHEGVGKLQFLKNSDQGNGYEVTVKTTVMQQGEVRGTVKSYNIKAGGKEHLGCNLSDIMPLTSYSRVIVSENKRP